MIISGIQKISLFDNDSASSTFGAIVQKNRILGNRGEGVFKSPLIEEDSAGLDMHNGDESFFEFECIDTVGNSQLRAWANEEKEVMMVVAGLEESVLWYEPATVTIVEPKSFTVGSRNTTKIRISKKGGLHKIWCGINILDGAVKVEGFESGWQDSDSNGLADGYNNSNLKSVVFSSGIQQAVQNASGYQSITKSLLFPIAGIQLSLSMNYTRLDNDVRHYLKTVTHTSTLLQIINATYSSTGHTSSLTIGTSPGTFQISLDIFGTPAAGATEDAQVHGKDAVLRVGNSNQYLNY